MPKMANISCWMMYPVVNINLLRKVRVHSVRFTPYTVYPNAKNFNAARLGVFLEHSKFDIILEK